MQSNWTWTFTFLTSQWSSNARESFDMLELNLLNYCRVTFLPISTAARGKLNFSHNCTFSVHSLGFWHVSASYWSFKTRLNRPSSLWRLLINSGWTKIVTHARSVVLIRKNVHTPHRNWLYVFAKFLALKEVNEILTATNIDLMLKQLLVGPFSCVIMGFFLITNTINFRPIVGWANFVSQQIKKKNRGLLMNSQKFSIMLMNR